MRPGAVFSGTPDEMAAQLKNAPEGTVVAEHPSGGVWHRRGKRWTACGWVTAWSSTNIADVCSPLTVLRWGTELPADLDAVTA